MALASSAAASAVGGLSLVIYLIQGGGLPKISAASENALIRNDCVLTQIWNFYGVLRDEVVTEIVS